MEPLWSPGNESLDWLPQAEAAERVLAPLQLGQDDDDDQQTSTSASTSSAAAAAAAAAAVGVDYIQPASRTAAPVFPYAHALTELHSATSSTAATTSSVWALSPAATPPRQYSAHNLNASHSDEPALFSASADRMPTQLPEPRLPQPSLALPTPAIRSDHCMQGLFGGPYQLLKAELPNRYKAFCRSSETMVVAQILPNTKRTKDLRGMLQEAVDSGQQVLDYGRCEILGPFIIHPADNSLASGSHQPLGSSFANLLAGTDTGMQLPTFGLPVARLAHNAPSSLLAAHPSSNLLSSSPPSASASSMSLDSPPRRWSPMSPPDSPPNELSVTSSPGSTSMSLQVGSGTPLSAMTLNRGSGSPLSSSPLSSSPLPAADDEEETYAPRALCKFSRRNQVCRAPNCRFLHAPGLRLSEAELQALPPLPKPGPGYVCHNCGSSEHFKPDCPQPQRCRFTLNNQVCQRPHCAFFHPPGSRQPPKPQVSNTSRPAPGYVCHSCGDTSLSHYKHECPLAGRTQKTVTMLSAAVRSY